MKSSKIEFGGFFLWILASVFFADNKSVCTMYIFYIATETSCRLDG